MTLSTSNLNKIKEFKQYIPNLRIISGPDIKEVNGNYLDVITYKSKDMGKGFIVEDTILIVDEKEVVDIRWKVNELQEGSTAKWITSLGYNDGESVFIAEGIIEGIITKEKGNQGFAFDPYFIPKELLKENITSDLDINYDLVGLTLSELDNLGFKKFFSARKKAIEKFVNKDFKKIINLKNIPEWKGEYQNS